MLHGGLATSVVDFVADCGADPTGVADCSGAFDKAYALIKALGSISPGIANSVRLYVPAGLYGLRAAPVHTSWDFSNLTTNCEIVGAGRDATIFQLYGFNQPSLVNLQNARLADFTVEGTTAGNDCVNGFELAYIAHEALVERVRFFNVRAQMSALYVIYCTSFHMNDCQMICCGAQTNNWGVVTVQGVMLTRYENCVNYDVGYLNGLGNGTQYVGNYTWLMVIGDHLKGGDQLVEISNSYFDEHARAGFRVIGEAAYPIQSLIVRNCQFTPPVNDGVNGNMVAGLDAKYINVVEIDGFSNNTLWTSGTSVAPAIQLSTIDAVYIRNLRLSANPPSNANFIKADSAVAYLRIENSPTLTPANILSKAGVTELPGQVSSGSATNGGGTFVVNVAIPSDQAATLYAEVFMSHVTGVPHLDTAGRLVAKCVAENQSGAGAAFVPALAGSVNPVQSNTAAFEDGDPQTADAGFGATTAKWTVAGGNAVLTVTNPGANTARVVVKLDEVLYGLGP